MQIGSKGLVAASDPSGIWNEDPCNREKRGLSVDIQLNHHLDWSEPEKIYRAWSLPHPALCVAAFPTCRQCTKEKLYGQYLLLVRLAHHSFIGRRGFQGTEHFHAFDSRSVDMRQWYNIRTNHPRKSILASGSMSGHLMVEALAYWPLPLEGYPLTMGKITRRSMLQPPGPGAGE